MADNIGYSPAGAGLSKLGDILLNFLMNKIQMDAQQKQFGSQQELEKKRIQMTQDMQKFQQDAETRREKLEGAGIARQQIGPNQPLTPEQLEQVKGTPYAAGLQETPGLGNTLPAGKEETGVQSLFSLPSSFFKATPDEQAKLDTKKQADDLQAFLRGQPDKVQARAKLGFDPDEPSYTTKVATEQTNRLATIALEHTNRMAEIDEQAKKALTLGDRQAITEVVKLWIAQKPDKTTEEADPQAHDKWVKSGMPLLRGLGHSNKDIEEFIKIMDEPAKSNGDNDLSNLPSVNKPSASAAGPSLWQNFLAAGRGANQVMGDDLKGGVNSVMDFFRHTVPVGSPSGSIPVSENTKPGFKYDTGCVDRNGKYHASSADCK